MSFETMPNPASEKPEIEAVEEEVPPMAHMVKAYQKISDDPEGAAYDALYNRLMPSLSDAEKNEAMKKLMAEYREYQKKSQEA